jgi:F-type H+-transporting ATPase subunit delta
MAELAVVRRYVRVLFHTAQQGGTGVVEQIESDLRVVDQVMRQVPRLPQALHAPTIPVDRKLQILDRAFGDRVSGLTLRFLRLAVDRRRERILAHVYPEFLRLSNELRNLVPVEVYSAEPLTDEERERLIAALRKRTGKQIQLNVSVDESLLGGMLVRMGDTILDGSVRTRLAQLRRQLLAARVV